MRMVAMLIVPIAAILMVNGAAIAVLLFGYGAATPEQAGVMGVIVSVFMIGLLPFTLFYVLLRGYYALEDTRTPFFITVVFSILLLALAFPLFQFGRDGGVQVAMLALAYSLSYWIGFVIAWVVLARRLGSLDSGRTVWMLARSILAGVVSGAVMLGIYVWVLTNQLSSPTLEWHARLILLLTVIASSVAGTVVFVVAAWAMRVREVSDVLSLLGRAAKRIRPGGQA
jgi:putative peptidoglycan lipid II flippase